MSLADDKTLTTRDAAALLAALAAAYPDLPAGEVLKLSPGRVHLYTPRPGASWSVLPASVHVGDWPFRWELAIADGVVAHGCATLAKASAAGCPRELVLSYLDELAAPSAPPLSGGDAEGGSL